MLIGKYTDDRRDYDKKMSRIVHSTQNTYIIHPKNLTSHKKVISIYFVAVLPFGTRFYPFSPNHHHRHPMPLPVSFFADYLTELDTRFACLVHYVRSEEQRLAKKSFRDEDWIFTI